MSNNFHFIEKDPYYAINNAVSIINTPNIIKQIVELREPFSLDFAHSAIGWVTFLKRNKFFNNLFEFEQFYMKHINVLKLVDDYGDIISLKRILEMLKCDKNGLKTGTLYYDKNDGIYWDGPE
jgi:hypothetical protein